MQSHRFALVMLALLLPNLAEASVWYVAPTGSNNLECGTTVSPCASVNFLLTNKVKAGDTIKMNPGTYPGERINITNVINHDNITLTATDTANIPQIRGVSANLALINIGNGVSGVTISHIDIRASDSGWDGAQGGIITVAEYPTTIDHCTIWNGGCGVLINTSQQVTVSNCTIHDCGILGSGNDAHGIAIWNHSNDAAATGWDQRIYVYNNVIYNMAGDCLQELAKQHNGSLVAYLDIENCTMYNADEQAIDSKGTSHVRIHGCDMYNNKYGGINTVNSFGPHSYWEIYNNKIHHHPIYAILQNQADHWTIWNNLIYNNLTNPDYNFCAVQLPVGDTTSTFYHNVVYNNTDVTGLTRTCGVSPYGNAANIKNNIFWMNGIGSNDHGNIRLISGEDLGIPTNNYVYPAVCGTTRCQTGNNAFTMPNPGMKNPAAFEFRLLSISPLIDQGTNAGITTDRDGRPRPLGAGYDIGAYETPAAPTDLKAAPASLKP